MWSWRSRSLRQTAQTPSYPLTRSHARRWLRPSSWTAASADRWLGFVPIQLAASTTPTRLLRSKSSGSERRSGSASKRRNWRSRLAIRSKLIGSFVPPPPITWLPSSQRQQTQPSPSPPSRCRQVTAAIKASDARLTPSKKALAIVGFLRIRGTSGPLTATRRNARRKTPNVARTRLASTA